MNMPSPADALREEVVTALQAAKPRNRIRPTTGEHEEKIADLERSAADWYRRFLAVTAAMEDMRRTGWTRITPWACLAFVAGFWIGAWAGWPV